MNTPPRSPWRWMRDNFWASLGFDAAVLVLAMWALHSWQTRDLPVNQPAPVMRAELLDSGMITEAVQPGSSGIVYFFAPWCGICRSSIDNLDQMLVDGQLAWASAVALDYSDAREVQAFVDETGIGLPVLLGDESDAVNWSIQAFPTYYVIAADGTIHSRTVGYSTWLGMRIRTWLSQ